MGGAAEGDRRASRGNARSALARREEARMAVCFVHAGLAEMTRVRAGNADVAPLEPTKNADLCPPPPHTLRGFLTTHHAWGLLVGP